MPELPDILLYLYALASRGVGQPVDQVRIVSPFVLRTFEPPVDELEGRTVARLDRVGKRIVFEFDRRQGESEPLFLVVHLMIAGRLRWRPPGAAIPGKVGLGAFDFAEGTLLITEAGSRKQASLHVISGSAGGDMGGALHALALQTSVPE